MKYFKVKNFDKFQHYKERNPPWIKVHRSIFDDYEFECLQDASKLHLMLIWVLASQCENKIPADPEWLKRKLGVKGRVDLKPLIDKGFLFCKQDASDLHTNADSETEESRDRGEKNTVENPFDFEKVWILYPLKDGKKQARRFFDGSVQNEQDWKDIHTALTNYLAHVDSVRKNGHPDRAYKNGSTWFNNWRDWLDFEVVKEETWAESRQRRKVEGVL